MRNHLQELLRTFIFHAVASHFVNGLIPVAVLFMLLTAATSDAYYEHTVFHLLCVTTLFIPLTFLSGVRDWQRKFHGGRAPIFLRKILLAIALALLCVTAITIRSRCPDPFAAGGTVAWLYGGCVLLALPLVFLLGHYGGKLAFAVRQKEPE